jgi:cytochrome c-type biogenesis protein CcmE
MSSEAPIAENKPESASEAPEKRPLTRRRKKKIMITAIVIIVALVILFWGWSSTGRSYLGVGTLVDSSATSIPAKYVGKSVEVQGVVSGWSGGSGAMSFKLVDMGDATKSMNVTMTGPLPEGFENGKTVVAKGELGSALPLLLTASEITVGCASKY